MSRHLFLTFHGPPLHRCLRQHEATEEDGNHKVGKKLPRYIVEADFKPAIFGSFKYDPLSETFVHLETSSQAAQDVPQPEQGETAGPPPEPAEPPGPEGDDMRKRASSTAALSNWWTRARLLLYNSTLTTSRVNNQI